MGPRERYPKGPGPVGGKASGKVSQVAPWALHDTSSHLPFPQAWCPRRCSQGPPAPALGLDLFPAPSPALPPPPRAPQAPPPAARHSLQKLLPGQAEVAAVQGPSQATLLAPLLPLKQQSGASLLNPPPVPVHVSLALFLLEPLQRGAATHHRPSPSRRASEGTALVVRWLRLRDPNPGSIPDRGTKIPPATSEFTWCNKDPACHS